MNLTHQRMIALFLIVFFAALVCGSFAIAALTHTTVWHFLSSFNASTAVMSPHN